MASAGDGERPRLPDTDDPYHLLGITPEADPKAIRQAYARLIRIYRPDRAPVEFQRIHAAFEEAQHGGRLRVVATMPRADRPSAEPAPADPPRPAEPGPARATPEPGEAAQAGAAQILRRLDEAAGLVERGDRAAAAQIVDQLLDERAPLDLMAERPEHARLVIRHPSLSWTRLVRASNDGAAIRTLWNQAWLAAYQHDLARARALLDDDRLRLDAADERPLAGVCISRIGALAWRSCDDLSALLQSYRAALPAQPGIDELLDDVGLDLEAAASLRSVATGHASAVLDPLRALLAADRIDDDADARGAAQALRAELERDIDATLRELDILHDRVELGPLFEAIYARLPIGATRLDRLDKSAFDQVTQALHDAGHEPHKWRLIGGTLAVASLIGAGLGWFAGFAAVAAAAGVALGTEGRRYRRSVRPALARALVQFPITTWIVSRWVQINGRLAGRLSRFDVAIDADRALYALSMLASTAIVLGRLEIPDEIR